MEKRLSSTEAAADSQILAESGYSANNSQAGSEGNLQATDVSENVEAQRSNTDSAAASNDDAESAKSLLSVSGKKGADTETAIMVIPDSPDGYEFIYAKEVSIDPELEGSFKDFAHQNGINADLAQKLVDFNCESVRLQQNRMAEQGRKWGDEVKKMPGWQGRAFNEKLNVAHTAVGRFVPDEVAELLDVTGYGNHPAVVKMFYEIGKNMSEDHYVDAPAAVSKRDPASILYPNQGLY